MRKTFRGGVHPKEAKELSRDRKLEAFDPPAGSEMVYVLGQHIGKPAKAVVKKNDPVLVGQVIAEADGFVSANIICSCSGTVKAVEKRRTIAGTMLECIVVENDGEYTKAEGIGEMRDVSDLTDQEILSCVRNAGIVGLGGAGFPTSVKLAPKNPDAIKYVIANGAECEPYLTCNDRLMREKAAEIVEGLEITLRLFKNAEGVIAIEKNKPEAISEMTKACAGKQRIRVLALPVKYPQGGERSLISVIAGIDFPTSKLPADVGCIVDNVGTLYAVRQAAVCREPLYTHVMTVSGDAVQNPKNLIVRDGTTFAMIAEFCGGVKEGTELKKAVCGGPMMGLTLSSLEIPVHKTTNGLLLMSKDEVEKAEKQQTACLHCGRCTTVCPQGLNPGMMAEAAEKGNFERYEKKLWGLECVACGSCSYICPAKRPLTQTFRQFKSEIMAKKRAEAAKAAAGGGK